MTKEETEVCENMHCCDSGEIQEELRWQKIAAIMLDCAPEELPQDLADRLDRVHMLVAKARCPTEHPCSLRSRQVIAAIIMQWELEQGA